MLESGIEVYADLQSAKEFRKPRSITDLKGCSIELSEDGKKGKDTGPNKYSLSKIFHFPALV